MKNILFISLLISINFLIVSCLGLGDSEKCDKFVEDYHNPAVEKYEEFGKKLKSYLDSVPMGNIKDRVWNNRYNNSNLSFDTSLDIDDIDGLNNHLFTGRQQDFNDSKKSFDALIKLGDESIESSKKIIDINSEVCKNKYPKANTYFGVDGARFDSRPGESDYKTKVEKLKKGVEKVMEINKAFRAKAKTALGL